MRGTGVPRVGLRRVDGQLQLGLVKRRSRRGVGQRLRPDNHARYADRAARHSCASSLWSQPSRSGTFSGTLTPYQDHLRRRGWGAGTWGRRQARGPVRGAQRV